MTDYTDIIRQLKDMHLTIATAESCTGGRISAALTAVPGASEVVQGGVVAYQNIIKTEILHVPQEIIEQYDVVSEQVAERMTKGVCELLNADIAVSTTGYVGPTGGSDKVKLGTVWIACGNHDKTVTKRLFVSKTREENLYRVVEEAFLLIEEFLNKIKEN